MKVILFIPRMYSLADMLTNGFEKNGCEVKVADYQSMMPKWYNKIYDKTVGFPNRILKHFKPNYYESINDRYLDFILKEKPDLILIYNNQFFLPKTLEKIKNNCQIVFYLGDNPLWSKTFDYNLEILKYSDLTISPDSYWMNELSSIGMPNIVCDFIGYSSKIFFPVAKISDKMKLKYQSDLLFIGRNYSDSSGFKRLLFLNSFEGLNLKIFGGEEWSKWLPSFSNLIMRFNLLESRISNEELNIAINCCKIYPIDQNTGIVNGIHARVFEVIGAGSLPVMEWRKDIDAVFGDLLPVIKNYNDSINIVKPYLLNERLRIETIKKLKLHMDSNYTPEKYTERLLNHLSNEIR